MAGALATLHSIVRFAIRNSWIIENPIAKLEIDERPHPVRRRQRVLGRDEIGRLLAACPMRYRPLIVTALYTGMRTSELLGLTWQDIDLAGGVLHVRAQLARAHRGKPARRVAPKTRAAIRDIPLVPQLARELREHQHASPGSSATGWVFATGNGTPLGHRNAQSRGLGHAARLAGLEDGGWPPLRFHDLRHTFASHLIIDLALDVAQVSRILGHAQVTTTLNIYTHLFDDARHACDIRGRMAASAFAGLLESEEDDCNVVVLPRPGTLQGGARSARARAAIRWAT
jgi:integrase